MSILKFPLILAAAALSGLAGAQEKPACQTGCAGIPAAPAQILPAGASADSTKAAALKLPRLVDLGASKCVPCKMMAPILDDLKKEFAGRMDVEFIDVWKTPEAGKAYGIRMIPTQIFFGVDGKESFRHEGFFGKDDILAKWKELGMDLGAGK